MPVKGQWHTCEEDGCNESFLVGHHLQRYCHLHSKATKKRIPGAPDLRTVSRDCQNPQCSNKIKGRRAFNKSVKYCTDDCRIQAQWTRQNDRRNLAKRVAARDIAGKETARRGLYFERLRDTGDGQRIESGEVSAATVAEFYGTTPANISRAMDAWRMWARIEKDKETWGWSWRVKALFPRAKMERLREIGLELRGKAKDDPEFNQLLDDLTRAFSVYSRWYFRFKKDRPIIKDFHLRWVRSILAAYGTGGKLYILSPPRHGKSEILIRLFVWLIVMDPTIRIGWLAASTKIAKVMLGKVKAYLQHNEALIADTLPPGELYKPHRNSGKEWSTTAFSIAQAPMFDQKSNTMTAFGRTSKILSLDFDVLCVDDIEDFDTCRDVEQRNYSKDKFLEFGTRKEEDTVWFGIGSHQHPDDIPNALKEGKVVGDDGQAWEIIVDSAHDEEGCTIDPDDPELYATHTECMLFPEVRSYRWLMEKKNEEAQFGEEGRYEMRYLNRPRPISGLVFNMTAIKEHLRRDLVLGDNTLPDGRLIAGLDPASRGTQAAVLWHYHEGQLTVLDIETQEAGGFAGALRVMEEWHDKYELVDWRYEDNSQQTEFFNDPRLAKLSRELGLRVRPHTTGRNKQDPELGISGMAPLYHDGTIQLPYGNADSRLKVNVLLRQLELWTTDGLSQRKKGKTDVKMASWLPFPTLVRWLREDTVQTEIRSTNEPSYPSAYRGSSPAWQTRYPGR